MKNKELAVRYIQHALECRKSGKGNPYGYLCNNVTKEFKPMAHKIGHNIIETLNGADQFQRNSRLPVIVERKATGSYSGRYKGRTGRRITQLNYQSRGIAYKKPSRPWWTIMDCRWID